MNERPGWAIWAPPLWFLGLDQVIDGSSDPFAARLAKLAFEGVAAVAGGTFLTYLWSYHRHRKRVIESPAIAGSGRFEIPGLVSDLLLPNPRTLAVFDFTARSLARSRHHRLILIGFCAVAVAVIAQGISQPQIVVAAPLALSLFTLTGLRYLFRHPIELRANWLFRIHQPGTAAPLLAGVERFVLYCGVVPIAALTLPAERRVLGAQAGLFASVACVLLSLMLMETLLFSFEKIPFTSSYFPGRRPLIETVVRYGVIAVIWIGGLSSLIRFSIGSTPGSAVLIALLLAGWWKARNARLDCQRVDRLEFEEDEEPAVQVLSIDRD